jgi:hypothetical protein
MNTILDLIAEHAGEIGSFLLTALVALLKRKMDKKKIKRELVKRGISENQLNGLL